jgi:hypothetical protein
MSTLAERLRPAGVAPEVADRQTQRYRGMSVEEKLRIADDMWRLAWELTCVGVRQRSPALSEEQVRIEARALIRAAAH